MLLMMPLLLCMILMMKLLLCLILLCPLVNFLMQIARAREKEIIESDYNDESDDEDRPIIPEGYVFDMESSAAILACRDRHELKRLLVKWYKESLKDKMRPDPAFATSPICIPDKDYKFLLILI